MIKKILIAPYITEKSMNLVPKKRYTFEVARKTSKAEIAQEVAKVYKVKVLSVRIINRIGKNVKFKQRYSGKRKDTKKAIVAISKNQTIKEFSVKE